MTQEILVLGPTGKTGRRVVRALEVVENTGGSFTARLPERVYADPCTVQVGVAIDRDIATVLAAGVVRWRTSAS